MRGNTSLLRTYPVPVACNGVLCPSAHSPDHIPAWMVAINPVSLAWRAPSLSQMDWLAVLLQARERFMDGSKPREDCRLCVLPFGMVHSGSLKAPSDFDFGTANFSIRGEAM